MLDQVDLAQTLKRKAYKKSVVPLQNRLHLLAYRVYRAQRPAIIVFEGWDAAGKGGLIRRLTERLDPRGYVVHAIKAPDGDDKERHYLYRFWRRLPEQGQMAIFDRSWYGRVLVERVEGFCSEAEWQRAYDEINQFEQQLLGFGTLLLKFWLHISPEEQLRRFSDRAGTPHKTWKLTDEDWRNREKWPDYEAAVNDMLLKTNTPGAPWTVVAADDKRHARVQVLDTVAATLAHALGEDT
jgi:AMP-polyphosphate phosphotransferase